MIHRGFSRVAIRKLLPNGEVEVQEKIMYEPDEDTRITIQNTGERYLSDEEILQILNEEEVKNIIDSDRYPLKNIRKKAITE